jgi:hypothetical protein
MKRGESWRYQLSGVSESQLAASLTGMSAIRRRGGSGSSARQRKPSATRKLANIRSASRLKAAGGMAAAISASIWRRGGGVTGIA